MKRIAIYGGTFNPPHLGHVSVVESALAALSPERLYVIPAYEAPHKQGGSVVDGDHRLQMLKLCFRDIPQVSVSDMELQRGGVSYTVDTLRQIRDEEPDAELLLVLGSDSSVCSFLLPRQKTAKVASFRIVSH